MTNIVNSKQKASPATRKLAKALGIDLSEIEGSGENGRIEAGDIEKYLKEKKKNDDEISDDIFVKKINEDDEFKVLEQRINMINNEEDRDDFSNEPNAIYTNTDTQKQSKEIDNADSDIIQFMIKHQNDIYDEDGQAPKDIIVNYDQHSNTITSEYSADEENSDEKEDKIDSLEEMNKEEQAQYSPVIEEVVSKEFDEEGEEIPVVPVENNVVHQVVVPFEEDPDDYPDTEREINESFGKRVVITLNDDTSSSVVINKEPVETEEEDKKQNHVVIETHTHNSVSMGIKAHLNLVKEMLASYSDLSERKVFNTIVKSIVFSLDKVGISSFDGKIKICKFHNNEIIEKKIEGVNELTVSQMDKNMVDIEDGEDIDYIITDMTSLNIDYYYPKAFEQKVDITVLIKEDFVKVYINACEDLISNMECAHVLSTIKSVINNPSLMLV